MRTDANAAGARRLGRLLAGLLTDKLGTGAASSGLRSAATREDDALRRRRPRERSERQKLRPPVETDVDFRPLPERRDVIAGWESRPHVPGATQDEVR